MRAIKLLSIAFIFISAVAYGATDEAPIPYNQETKVLIEHVPMFSPEPITPMKLLKLNHHITQGLVCYSPLEVKCIDEICGNSPRSFWRLKVNGDWVNYNANSPLKPSDVVEWDFVS